MSDLVVIIALVIVGGVALAVIVAFYHGVNRIEETSHTLISRLEASLKNAADWASRAMYAERAASSAQHEVNELRERSRVMQAQIDHIRALRDVAGELSADPPAATTRAKRGARASTATTDEQPAVPAGAAH